MKVRSMTATLLGCLMMLTGFAVTVQAGQEINLHLDNYTEYPLSVRMSHRQCLENDPIVPDLINKSPDLGLTAARATVNTKSTADFFGDCVSHESHLRLEIFTIDGQNFAYVEIVKDIGKDWRIAHADKRSVSDITISAEDNSLEKIVSFKPFKP